jgi:hypothetical protein
MTIEMNEYPALVTETTEMIAWLDGLMKSDEDPLVVAGFVARSYRESLTILQSALVNDPHNPDLQAGLAAILAASPAALAYAERVQAKAVAEARRATKH